MKPFAQYLQEINKVYEFSIKVAGIDCDKSQQEKLKSALETYAVEKFGPVKRLPIQEHADFPGCGPMECHMVDVSVRYPVVSDQVAQLVAEKLNMSRKHVLVRTKGEEAIHAHVAEPKKAKDGSVLNNPDLDSESAQPLVGEARKESMLKELESRKYEFAAKPEAVKTVNIPTNNVSPVGTHQNKIPSPVKGK
jgi:hypothetical protein